MEGASINVDIGPWFLGRTHPWNKSHTSVDISISFVSSFLTWSSFWSSSLSCLELSSAAIHWKFNILVTEILDLRSFQILGIDSRSVSRANCMDCMIECGNYLPVFPGLFVCLSLKFATDCWIGWNKAYQISCFDLYGSTQHASIPEPGSIATNECNRKSNLKVCANPVWSTAQCKYTAEQPVWPIGDHTVENTSDPLVFTPVKNMLCLTHQCYHILMRMFMLIDSLYEIWHESLIQSDMCFVWSRCEWIAGQVSQITLYKFYAWFKYTLYTKNFMTWC